MALDLQIDRLYQLPPAEFTAARNALAKTLVGADAQRVKHLQKPTVVPWAINQLYWNERHVFERLLKTGAALREAQMATLSGKGKRTDVERASDTHRKALADAVHHSVRLAGNAGLKPEADALSKMLEAVSLTQKHGAQPGRFADVIQPAGFEALTGVTPQPAADRKRIAKAEAETRRKDEAARRAIEAEIRKAEETLAEARRRETTAKRNLTQAENDVRSAEKDLESARVRLSRL